MAEIPIKLRVQDINAQWIFYPVTKEQRLIYEMGLLCLQCRMLLYYQRDFMYIFFKSDKMRNVSNIAKFLLTLSLYYVFNDYCI